ncbi:MAG: hypothetical protein C4288_19525 [Leptolyngbya sp. ERB_1_1]
MAIPFFPVLLDVQPPGLTFYAQQRSTRRSRRNNPDDKNRRESPNFTSADSDRDSVSQDVLWGVLLESVTLGVMVLASSLQLVYCNEKAKDFCDRLFCANDELPISIIHLCQRLMQEEDVSSQPLIMEYQEQEQYFRLQARWMNFSTAQPLLLVLIEDCHESLRQELEIEQDKYDLTDREAEIWFLLRQKYSYQNISDLLKISLNTVKTHVKNIYSKRKNLANERRIWYSR